MKSLSFIAWFYYTLFIQLQLNNAIQITLSIGPSKLVKQTLMAIFAVY